MVRIWSLIENTKRLFRTSSSAGGGAGGSDVGAPQLLTVHGIKVLTLMWIMVTHTYLFGGFYNALWLYQKLVHVIELPSRFWFQAVFNAWMLVDSFFFLSGLLLVYTMLPLLARSGRTPSFFLYMCHRLVRLLPAMTGAMCFQFLYPLLFRGPPLLDNDVHHYQVTTCEQNWWANLIFVSNWIEPSKMVKIQ